MAPRRRIFWAGVLAPVVLLLTVVAAWAIDTGAAGGEVLRNVEVEGIDIGGLASDELLEQIESLDDAARDRVVKIETPDDTYETTAEAIGLSVDVEATAQAALDEGRTAILPIRPLGWLASFFRPHEVAVDYVVDPEQARVTLRQLEGDALASPVEPTIESINGDAFTVVPGKPGSGIDPDTLAIALGAAAEDTPIDEAVSVKVRQSDLSPRLDDQVARDAADEANELTSTTMSITAEGVTFQLVPRELRQLAEVQELEDTIAIRLDPEKLLPVLATEFDELEVDAVDATFTLDGGRPVISPSVTGLSCCDLGNVEAVNTALLAGESAVTIELTRTEPDRSTEEAEALGIVEEVGSPSEFGPTTNHGCCEGRVTNIHRIADIVRGAIIEPGETFSVNGFVGQRTREKGFVEAGVIYDGVVTADVGGGVSQFATTLFNAALFAGLDFGEYQSHSLYISRYPRGHEATISWEHPDLEIVNNTEYGVMIWPEYTDTSLTVRLYSTRHIDVTVGEPTSAPSGNCTRWTTPRTRTYPDGRTDSDTVSARYRPSEGVNC
ncbi:VanW family protein [Actinospongicola halichondriae]|uniref:VanW family protein n=1 Tax=Actinospongicola halichondriae TaxID=3236844 RepID=UPI003D569EC5